MVLRCIGITILAILTCTTVTATDFHVSGRVDVIAALTVSVPDVGSETAGERAILVQGTQDQCLDVNIVALGDLTAADVLTGSGDGTRVFIITDASTGESPGAVPTIQIHVN
jgi:hypothetical protein